MDAIPDNKSGPLRIIVCQILRDRTFEFRLRNREMNDECWLSFIDFNRCCHTITAETMANSKSTIVLIATIGVNI